jgi:thiosulfate reductase cytochrome b subunit
MTASPADIASPPPATRVIHPVVVRLTHWINAFAMVIMILSGWEIYNAYPILPFRFPAAITLGDGLASGILWHFAAMWLLVVNGLIYIGYGVASGRFRRKLWPVDPRAVMADVKAAISGRLSHNDLSTYNAIQRLLYASVILAGIVVTVSGIAMWKPVQFQELTALMGGFDNARIVHFAAMAFIVGFTLIHVIMALLVPRSLRAMLRGR